MSQRTAGFVYKKLLFPLGGVMLLMLISAACMQLAGEKERRLWLLSQEVQRTHGLLQEATILQDKGLLQEFPHKVYQLNVAFDNLQATLDRGATRQQEQKFSAVWQQVKSRWQVAASADPLRRAYAAGGGADISQQLLQSCMRLANAVEQEALLAKQQAGLAFMLLCALSLGVCFYLFLVMRKQFVQPLQQLEQQVAGLLQGNEFAHFGIYELTQPMQQQLALFARQQQQLAFFAEKIGEGNAQQVEEEVDRNGLLGKALQGLHHKMQAYFLDEERRRWSSQGIEQFTRLLRENNQEVEGLCKKLISQLVPFIDANQGGIFLVEEEKEQQVLTLKAAYAWGRHKFLNKTILPGEGLVGQVMLDRELVLITDVPDGYINIGSGLGRAKPRCILLLPLIANEQLVGVVELASFRVFGQHELDFLKKLAESIASTLITLQVSSQTRSLLDKANTANAHLQAQEEELRQNTEELMATQEAMQKKEMELGGLFASINYSLITAEFNVQGQFCLANEKLQELSRFSAEELLQKHCFELLQLAGWSTPDKQAFLEALLKGEPQNLECQLMGQPQVWLSASFTPVQNSHGQVYKIMMLATDISEKKVAELTYIAQAEEIIKHEEQLREYTAELEQLQAGLSKKLQEARQEMQRQIEEIAAEKVKNEAILEGCVDGVVSFSDKGLIDFFNHAAEDIWEMERDQVLHKHIQTLMPLEIVWQGPEPQVFYSKNGHRKTLDIRSEVPISGVAGSEVEALITLTRVRVNGAYMFTAFVQKVAVELF